MKALKHSFIYLLLVATPFFESGADTFVCDKNVVELPGMVKIKSPPLDYVGRAADGRPVFYQPQSEVVYIFEKDFKKQPQMIKWNANSDSRTKLACDGTAAVKSKGKWNYCPWSTIHSWGISFYMSSLDVRCEPIANEKTPNKSLLNANPIGCIQYDKPIGDAVMARCCDKLELNPNTLNCDEPALIDLELKNCSTHNDCTKGMGCFPQRSKDLFDFEEAAPLADIVSAQIKEWTQKQPLKQANKSCNHSKECASYSCASNKCVPAMVCRFADQDEYAQTGINCIQGLEKDAGNVCKQGPGYSPYIGMIEDINFKTEGECSFTMDEDQLKLVDNAMKTIRAMEWLFSRVSQDKDGDCFRLLPHLREKIAKKLTEARRTILHNYNEVIRSIEQDFHQVMNAKEGNMAVTNDPLHGSVTMKKDGKEVPLTEHDIATRQTGGYDSLMIMYRRNALFMAYEQAMLEVMNEIHPIMKDLHEHMGKWGDDDQSWNLGSGVITPKCSCKASYQKWVWWKQEFNTYHHDVTKKRWETYYDVRMDVEGNKKIVDKENIKAHMGTLFSDDYQKVMPRFTQSHALIDPLNHGANSDSPMKFDNFGSKIDLNVEKSFWDQFGNNARTYAAFYTAGLSELVGFFKSNSETRYARKLNGSNNGTYSAIHEAFKADIKEYYKSLLPEEYKEASAKPIRDLFVYEPEIVGLDAKNCALDPNAPNCAKYNDWVEQMTDMAFAQFMLYSYHDQASYTNYFRNPERGRPILFARYTTDLNNLAVYYKAVIEKREKQNKCIQKQINNVEDNFDNSEGSGIDLSATSYGNGAGTGGNGAKGKTSGGKSIGTDLKPFHINLRTGKPMDFTSAQLDSIAQSSKDRGGSAGNVAGGAIIANAIRERAAIMKATNARAKAKGIDLDAAEEGLARSLGMKKTVNGRPLATAGNAKGNETSSRHGGSGGQATIDAEATAVANDNQISSGELGAGEVGKGGPGNNSGMGLFGSGNISDGGAGENNKISDSSGMSDEEKDVMMANLDRNKSKYNPNEDDGLFGIVSKAYARNLEKILIRKKKIED